MQLEILAVFFVPVVFGAVVRGEDVVRAVERIGSQSGKTSQEVRIAASGEIKAESASSSSSGGGGDEPPKKKKKKKSMDGAISHKVKDVDI